MKKFLAILMTTVLCFGMPFYAFAANVSAAEEQENLADGEFIIHQDDDITITAIPASMVDEESLAARATTYGSVWLDKSSEGNFKIKTSLRGTIGVTFKVESSSNNSWAFLTFKSPAGKDYFDNGVTVNPTTGNGDGYYFHIKNAKPGTYTVGYRGYTSVGMRIMCWMY